MYFSILFNNFSSSILNVFLIWRRWPIYISPIITLRFDLNNDLSISINTDSYMGVEKDIFFSGFIWYDIQNINTYPSSPFILYNIVFMFIPGYI